MHRDHIDQSESVCVLDASCLINLINGKCLCAILKLRNHTFLIGPIVRSECHKNAAEITRIIDSRRLNEFDDDQISATLFLDLLDKHRLGNGETECLAYCISTDASMASDDWRARKISAQMLGSNRIIGSIKLLTHCVTQDIIGAEEAYDRFEIMRRCGGFLPKIQPNHFDT